MLPIHNQDPGQDLIDFFRYRGYLIHPGEGRPFLVEFDHDLAQELYGHLKEIQEFESLLKIDSSLN